MAKHRVWIFVGLLLGTWAHFSDPPMSNEPGEDPHVKLPVKILSLSLLLLLLFKLFVYSFVISLAVFLGVFLFVLVVAYYCKRQLLFRLYRRTWTFKVKIAVILLLIAALASRFPFKPRLIDPATSWRKVSSHDFKEFFVVAHFMDIGRRKRWHFRNHAHSNIRRMLLVSCGSVER